MNFRVITWRHLMLLPVFMMLGVMLQVVLSNPTEGSFVVFTLVWMFPVFFAFTAGRWWKNRVIGQETSDERDS